MATSIFVPNLPGVDIVTLARWLKRPGEAVKAGEELAEVESDKATLAIESPADGILGATLVEARGQSVNCGASIGLVLASGEADAVPQPVQPPPTVTPAYVAMIPDAERAAPPATRTEPARELSSPLARRLARERGIDLQGLIGSGPKGRIVRMDIERAIASLRSATPDIAAPRPDSPGLGSSPGTSPSPKPPTGYQSGKPVPLSAMRRAIAQRLTHSKQTIPHFYLRRDVRLDALLALRSEINGGLSAAGTKLTLTDYFIKAAAMALQQVPEVNVVWDDERILQFDASDISVAVSVAGGLYTPVLRDLEQRSLSAISAELRRVVQAAKDRRLQPSECDGGTMTISNLGMFDVDSFDAIINPPQSMILAIGRSRSAYHHGTDGAGGSAYATFTLSVDHRVIDGATAADFMSTAVKLLEKPLAILC